MSKWTEENTLKFVQEYIRNECLWNYKHKDYRNKEVKELAIADIAKTMGLPYFGKKEVVLKIKSIRSTYSQELKKGKTSVQPASGIDDTCKSNLKWFPYLYRALQSIDINRKPENFMKNVEETSSETTLADVLLNLENDPQEQLFLQPVTSTSKRKRKQHDPNLTNFLIENVSEPVRPIIPPTVNGENEFDLFAKSVACQLKNMPLTLALKAQQHIQNYLCDLRIRHITSSRNATSIPQQSTDYTPSPSQTCTNLYSRSPSPAWGQQSPNPTENYENNEECHNAVFLPQENQSSYKVCSDTRDVDWFLNKGVKEEAEISE